MRRGDVVLVSYGGRELRAMIVLASENNTSLMLMFEGLLDGCVGAMPLLKNEDVERERWTNVMTGHEIGVRLSDVV